MMNRLGLKKEWVIFSGAIALALLILLIAQISTSPKSQTPASSQSKFTGKNAFGTLKPHRATYDIKLIKARGMSSIIDVVGTMTFEWRSDCDSATSSHSFNTRYNYADSAPIIMESDFSTHESHGGAQMDFTSLRKKNGILVENIRGHADRDARKIEYTRPALDSQKLPDNVVFPTYHSLAVLNAAQSGQKIVKVKLFDGNHTEGVVEVNTIITKDAAPYTGESSPAIDQSLLEAPAKELQLAFFPLAKNAETADYEMTLIFHENGVMRKAQIEYDDFTLVQTLTALEKLPEICKN